ncbi:MAG: hypothetical protein KDB79_09985 [Acidobacteria bacterium]|nr:hypothetical protein [Acidobacteriota bacterium]
MKFQKRFAGFAFLITAFVLISYSSSYAQDSFEFRVKNNTRVTIKQLLVAEPGADEWKYFRIGSGIAPGRTMRLIWDQSTNDEQCIQWFKAVYANGVHSQPARFDFCAENLLLVFS